MSDFREAFNRVSPSVILGSETDQGYQPIQKHKLPSLSSLGGLDGVIRDLETLVMLPFQRPELFFELGIKPPSGILLCGPPGTGKTTLALALASSTPLNVMFLDPGNVRSKIVGESEAALAGIFRKAKKASPTLLIIDQIELIGYSPVSFDQLP